MSALLEHPTSTLRDQALILRGLAQQWDTLVGAFHPSWDEQNPTLLERFMIGLVQPYAHDSHTREGLAGLMRQLVTQVKALDDYRTLGTVPDGLDEEEAYGNAPAEVLVNLLEGDIDLSVWELLRGEVMPCRRCQRLNAFVWTWGVADWPRSAFCTRCKAEATGGAL